MQAKKTSQASSQTMYRQRKQDDTLPPIPDKRYFTIGEAATLCAVKPHVLRYWEQEFSQLKPSKRRGNRRYYQHQDVLLVRQIRKLLYDDGFTIEGARLQLTNTPAVTASPPVETVPTDDAVIQKMIAELEHVLKDLTQSI